MSFDSTVFRSFAIGTWGGLGQFRMNVRGQSSAGMVVYRSTGSQANPSLSGVTRDSAGAVLVSCEVDAFVTGTDAKVATVTSDAVTGAFQLFVPVSGPFYLVAYKAGAPDVAGTTVNTLAAV